MFGTVDPGCQCPHPTDLLTAAMHGVELDPCPVHQADEITARQRAADAADLESVIDRIHDRHQPPPPTGSQVPLGGAGLAGLIAAHLGVAPDQEH